MCIASSGTAEACLCETMLEARAMLVLHFDSVKHEQQCSRVMPFTTLREPMLGASRGFGALRMQMVGNSARTGAAAGQEYLYQQEWAESSLCRQHGW